MDKYMKGQMSALVVFIQIQNIADLKTWFLVKALPWENFLALTSKERIPELSYNCNAKLIMVKKSLWPRVQRYFLKGFGIQQPIKIKFK